jgi:hypothetical protein
MKEFLGAKTLQGLPFKVFFRVKDIGCGPSGVSLRITQPAVRCIEIAEK